jgi:hypothetical protein
MHLLFSYYSDFTLKILILNCCFWKEWIARRLRKVFGAECEEKNGGGGSNRGIDNEDNDVQILKARQQRFACVAGNE